MPVGRGSAAAHASAAVDPRVHAGRAILTIAMGRSLYWNMAVNLARSVRRWHDPDSLPIFIVTDRADVPPRDLAGVHKILAGTGELGVGFETKLHLDRVAPAAQTLFIDADCLVYASLDATFDRFAGQAVGVVQEGLANSGERFGDIASYCVTLGVSQLPLFTGGIYYIEPDVGKLVYEEARRLLPHYDEMGLVRLRGLPNEEPLVAGAMAKFELWGIPDDGSIIGDFQTSPGPHSLDVLSGRRRMSNPPSGESAHCAWAPVRSIEPAIVHFLGHHIGLPAYRSESMALRLTAHGVPEAFSRLFARATILLPGRAAIRFKNTLRPLYRKLLGTRKIRPTNRTTASNSARVD